MRKPNFFMLGAPKSGSTALYTYLASHPQVFLPRLKEPRFFAEDFGSFREITELLDYESLFAKAPHTALAIGDGSPWYLCSQVAVSAIRSYAPAAKALVILRNPLEMLPSLHNQFLFSFKEDESDLCKAWHLQESRNLGYNLPPAHPAPALLQYGKLTLFGDQLDRLFGVWPQEQIHVVLFDDFRKNTSEVYRNILSFLELDDDGRSDFPVINEASSHRHGKIGWAVASPASPLNRFLRASRSFTGLRSTGVLAALLGKNRSPGKKAQLEGSFRNDLIDFYRKDVEKLGSLLGRDLQSWLQ